MIRQVAASPCRCAYERSNTNSSMEGTLERANSNAVRTGSEFPEILSANLSDILTMKLLFNSANLRSFPFSINFLLFLED